MLTLIGILLYILSEMIFTEYAPPKSTNWSVFYFVMNFTSFIIISLDQFIKSYDRFIRWISLLFILFFMTSSFRFLMQINKSYDLYLISVNDYFIDTVRYIFFIISLILISLNFIIKWVKH